MTDQFTLTTLAPEEELQLAAANIPVIKPAYKIPPSGGYKAMDHLPESINKAEVLKNAADIIGNPAMTQIAFLKFVTSYESEASPAVQAMLANFRAKDAGEAGRRVADLLHETNEFGEKMPEMDEDFKRRYLQGMARASEIQRKTQWLWKQIERIIRRYEDMLELTEEERTYHMGQFDLSFESAVRAEEISDDEDEREKELIVLVATMEHMAVLLAEAFETGKFPGQEEELSEDDIDRLQKVGILLNARILSLRPMIQKANASSQTFAMKSNSNALTALKQYDFAQTGITDWQTDIAGQIDALQNLAMNMAYLEAVEFTEAQSRATADSFDDQMKSMAEVLKKQLASIETMNYITEKFQSGLTTLGETIAEEAVKGEESAVAMDKNMEALKAAEKELARQTSEAMKKAAA